MQRYAEWNRKLPLLLWLLVIIGLLASLPMVYERVRTESSAKKVEIVFNYRSLLEIADYRNQPREFVERQLEEMKGAGIHSLAVFELTLNDLKLARSVRLFNAQEAALLQQTAGFAEGNDSYLLFADETERQLLQPVIERGFAFHGIGTEPWSFGGLSGLIIRAPLDEAVMKPLGPNLPALETVKANGFEAVARISNRMQPFNAEYMEWLLSELSRFGVRTVVPDGDYVPGYGDGQNTEGIAETAELMKTYGMSLAVWEIVKPPNGLQTLAAKLDYDVIRLRSFSDADADKLAAALSPEQLEGRIKEAADKFVLAVKDRNIRMLFLNARVLKNVEKASYTDPLAPIYEMIGGEGGVRDRLEKAGFTLQPAHSFIPHASPLEKGLRPLVVLGGVALIVLAAMQFFPLWGLPLFALGIAASAGLYVQSPSLLEKVIALGAGVCAATLGMVLAIRSLRRKRSVDAAGARIGIIVNLLIRSTIVSLMGAGIVVGLMSDVRYSLLLDQFRGVNVLALMPVLLTALYLLFFSEGLTYREMAAKAARLVRTNVNVLWVIIAGVLVFGAFYYLTRTGNTGKASAVELALRYFLEDTLNVRPRNKEFLIGHPLYLFGAYLSLAAFLKNRANALYLFVFGAIGQASLIGTFTHLHTPLFISVIRTAYGLLFGVIIGLLLIAAWEILAKGWSRWANPAKRS